MLAAAFLLDLWIGDPVYRFHPIRLMGRAIEQAETFLRNTVKQEKIAGGILAFFFPLSVFLFVWGLIFLLAKIHPWLAWAAGLFGIYSSISIHDLRKEGLQIDQDLNGGNLENAQRNLARIVGRDTHSLDEKEILRASIETIAESTLDGVVAPLFYAAIGGAPLALAYKAVNTLDSIVGHKNERYQHFGFLSAKLDELWNWIPARLSYFAIALATLLTGDRFWEACRAGWRHGILTQNGNGAVPEAAFAGALGLRLGGANRYEGRVVSKPFLGFSEKSFECQDLKKALKLMMTAAWVLLFGILLFKYAIGR